MKYISVKEAALNWGISARLVQRYCTDGRIVGAEKFGTAWMIPDSAKKPCDPRTEKRDSGALFAEIPHSPIETATHGAEESLRHRMMPLANTSFKIGECMDNIIKTEDADTRSIALAEYYYFSGQSEKASEIAEGYLSSDDIRLRLSACWICAYANLALDRVELSRLAIETVNTSLRGISIADGELMAMSVFASHAVAVLLHLPIPEGTPSLWDFIHLLPTGLRLFALYIQAHDAYLQREYSMSLGIVETAFALEGETYPIPTIYLHLVATMDYMSLKQPDKARAHLLAAWHIAKPDGLIEPFAEHHGLVGGMIEAVIKREFPADFKKIIAITYKFSAGWRRVHNGATGNSVASDLSTTEFAVAMLAARGWLNKEIALHLGISENTVKQHISTALQKLGISQRKEFAKFMLK